MGTLVSQEEQRGLQPGDQCEYRERVFVNAGTSPWLPGTVVGRELHQDGLWEIRGQDGGELYRRAGEIRGIGGAAWALLAAPPSSKP